MVKCHTMGEVRREIDRIDRELAKLLAERQGYIEQAGRIKGERNAVRDEARIEDVVQKALAAADQHGLSHAIAEPVWRLLIEKSIEHEYTIFDAKTRKTAGT
ncbi:chorismate mutase [Parvibaculum sp.]|uniref:chorismate mutase n=1 Tax=Parvibaculum sp. TaxID=2024848 RepID=UPI002CEF1FE5|nr:chorismate mutase [Parvibaculum sp.]HUD51877.1 chorismate mutase [Parvibaculum sp.]